jgi:hypothetical protein
LRASVPVTTTLPEGLTARPKFTVPMSQKVSATAGGLPVSMRATSTSNRL